VAGLCNSGWESGINLGSFPNQQSKMWYAFYVLWGTAIDQIFQYLQEDGTMGQGDPPAIIQLLEVTFWKPNWVATEQQTIHEIIQIIPYFSQSDVGFQLIPTALIGTLPYSETPHKWGYWLRWTILSCTKICLMNNTHSLGCAWGMKVRFHSAK